MNFEASIWKPLYKKRGNFMGIFSMENAFGRFLDLVWKWIVLNFLCMVCSIPIITIGPSVTAMYYVLLKIAKGEDTSLLKDYFRSFKRNLKQGMMIQLLLLATAVVIGLTIYYCRQLRSEYTLYGYWLYALYVVVLLYLMMGAYVYPLLSMYENTLKETLKNALLLPIAHIGWTVLILLINIGPLYLCYVNADIMKWGLFFYTLCGIAVVGQINSKIFVKIFAQYEQKEEIEHED